MATPPSIGALSEAVGLLMQLDRLQIDDATKFLHDLQEPGSRYIDGEIVYSAAFLSEIPNQERLEIQ